MKITLLKKYWAEILFSFSLIFIISYEYWLKNMNPWWRTAEVSGYIADMLAYGYVASYVVYFLTVYLPQRKEKKKNNEYLLKQMGFLIKDFNDIHSYYIQLKNDKTGIATDGVDEIYDYNSDPKKLVSLSEEDILEMCKFIYPLKDAPTTRIGYNEKMEFYTKQETWAELLKRFGDKSIDLIRNLYQFSHLLDIEDIKLLNKIEYSTYIQTVCNYNKGFSALVIKRSTWEGLGKPMHEYYLFLNIINKKVVKDQKK
ncbi:hypothetical protein ACWKTB_21500 [Bacillus cereus]|uniref:hypothetical protein n=1 Tax=Bacillus cereus TaxID=1396 RepID=UPI0028ACE489|nr:hypothetical protein [Bacillus cereus]WNN02554.1 hypothetical protein RPB93_27665 [Bacillus cereus]